MLSADGIELEIGDTIYVVRGDRFVEHNVAGFEGDRVLFEQPECDGVLSCARDDAYFFVPAATQRLNFAFA